MRNQETRNGNQSSYRRAGQDGETAERWEGSERQVGSQGPEGRSGMGMGRSEYDRQMGGGERFEPSQRGESWQSSDRWGQDERYGQQGVGQHRDYERGMYGDDRGFSGRSQYGQSMNTDRDRWGVGENAGYGGRGRQSQYEGSQQYGGQQYGRQQHEDQFGGQFGGQQFGGRQQQQGPFGGRQPYDSGQQYGGRQQQYEGGMGRMGGGMGRFERHDQGFQGDDRFGMGGESPNYGSMPSSQYGGWQQGGQNYGQSQYGQSQYGQGQWQGRMGMGQEQRQNRGPKGYKRSDERIREDVSERLGQHYDLDASDITVTVNNGEITLEGTVPMRHHKHIAEMIVESVSGVQDVTNQLRVKRAGSSASDMGEGRQSQGTQMGSQSQGSQTGSQAQGSQTSKSTRSS